MRNGYENLTFVEALAKLEHGNILERAVSIALRFGGNDGAHHKQWVIDQMLRVLCGAAYETLIAIYNRANLGVWDEGVAP